MPSNRQHLDWSYVDVIPYGPRIDEPWSSSTDKDANVMLNIMFLAEALVGCAFVSLALEAATGKHSRLNRLLRLSTFIRPRVPDGRVRLEWTCSCGRAMYGDYAKHKSTPYSNHVRRLPGCKVLARTSLWYSLVSLP